MSKYQTTLLILLLFLTITTSTFTPIDNYLLNCGTTTNTVISSRPFLGDSHLSSLSLTPDSSHSIQIQPGTTLHDSVRVFIKPIHYKFSIKKNGMHIVRLHFYPLRDAMMTNGNNEFKFKSENAMFSVTTSNGLVLLHDYKPESDEYVIKEFTVNIDGDVFVMMFSPSTSEKVKKLVFGFVNAIEVFSCPDGLIGDTARFVDNEEVGNVNGLMKNGFETVYRVNVRGERVTPFNDTLWRTWVVENGFLSNMGVTKVVHYSGRIKYQVGSASREVAPDHVYDSGRVYNVLGGLVPDINVAWVFKVRLGFKYMLRMHFCDIVSMALNELYFNVYVNGNMAYKDFDISGIGNQLATPYYVDFVVDPIDFFSDHVSGLIDVSIGPSNLSSPGKINVILNGLEIFKLNNSMGSLDGQVSVDTVLHGQSKDRSVHSIFLPLFAAVCLLTAAYVVAHSRKDDAMGWTQLPVDALQRKHGSVELPEKLVYL